MNVEAVGIRQPVVQYHLIAVVLENEAVMVRALDAEDASAILGSEENSAVAGV